MKFEKLVPNVFYVDINEALKLFVDCLEFKIGHSELKSRQPFCVVEKDGLRINLFQNSALAKEHHPEFRLVTKNIEEVYKKVSESYPEFLHPNLKEITLRPWSAKEFALRDNQLGIVIQQWPTETLYHGTKADLKKGDLIEPGFSSNYGKRNKAKFVYLTATLDAAIWGAELAIGEMPGRIYSVEPMGHIEDDPNLTDKKFPGNPTKSYRTESALNVVGEVTDWEGHSPEQLKAMQDHLEKLKQQGIEAIED